MQRYVTTNISINLVNQYKNKIIKNFKLYTDQYVATINH